MKKAAINRRDLERLFEGILQLKTASECRKFFRDLCTLSELRDMAERFAAAKKISAGEPYRKISKELGTSTATVSRIALWLNNGTGGYNLVLNRLANHHHNSSSFGKGLY